MAGLLQTCGMSRNCRWSKWCLELSRAWNKYCIMETGNGHCQFLYDITYVGDSNTYKANNYILRRFSISCVRLVVTNVKFTNSCLRHTVRHVRDNMPHLWIDKSVTGEDYQLSSVGPANLIKAPRPSPESRHFASDILISNSFDKYFGLSPVCSTGQIGNWSTVGRDNDLTPNRREPVMSANDDIAPMHHWLQKYSPTIWCYQ